MGKRNAEHRNHHEQETPVKKQKIQSPPSSPEDDIDRPEFELTRELVDNTILTDLTQKQWRIGKPIGKGSFGEIFLASDDTSRPVTTETAKYVAKIEPHSNGPLFVEIHCLLSTAKATDEHPLPPGMPQYIASGSHHFASRRYRFLILQRFKCDLHSIIKNRRVSLKHLLILAKQILDILEHLHDNGYAHSDIKAENLMIGSCTYDKEAEMRRLKRATDNALHNSIAFGADDDHENASQGGGNNNRKRAIRTKKDEFLLHQTPGKPYSMRNHRQVSYKYNDDDIDDVNSDSDDDEDFNVRSPNATMESVGKKKRSGRGNNKRGNVINKRVLFDEPPKTKFITEDHIYLIDFGLASKFLDSNGTHHPFCMDQRRAHDGTLEFTSRDAHMGAHSRRSDLECLGFNLMYWTLGSLPWKDDKLMNQPEHVHRMKEIFMTDAREMLKLIYGQQVPKFLGDYLCYVNELAYDERPDYEFLRQMFTREFTDLGHKASEMVLNISDLKRGCVDEKKVTNQADNRSDKINNVKSIAKLGLLLPIKDLDRSRRSSMGLSQISPKNLRSKAADKKSKKQRTRFSWAEVLSQDPDQIARQRAEKEFEREQMMEIPNKYKGQPTYAILEIENRLKAAKENNNETKHFYEEPDYIKGYTKTMMEIARKISANKISSIASPPATQEDSSESSPPQQTARCRRRKSTNPTKIVKSTRVKQSSLEEIHDNFYIRPKRKNEAFAQQLTPPPSTTDESSCSSNASSDSDVTRAPGKRQTTNFPTTKGRYNAKNGSAGTSRSSSHTSIQSMSSNKSECTTSGISSSVFFDEDADDEEEFHQKVKRQFQVQPVKKRRGRPPGKCNQKSRENPNYFN
ncbi:uncharacterized protein LOC134837103 isoform X2 [Culicoides brevitarsis]|uniref:uncharacterized protein LOC134837103 isoform X2 n=1 Tax=Culicoides brevitarsis TaxID=469753 RepID=UPI00307CB3AC